MNYETKAVFATLLFEDIEEKVARSIAINQVELCGSVAMSPADIDIHCPEHGLSTSEQMHISDVLEDYFASEDEREPEVTCPLCQESTRGSIYERGLFLLAHRELHIFESRMDTLLTFGDFDSDGRERGGA